MTGFLGSLELIRKTSSEMENSKYYIKIYDDGTSWKLPECNHSADTMQTVNTHTHTDYLVNETLTKLIKVCVNAVEARNRAHKSCFEECRPLVYQTSVASKVILPQKGTNTVCQEPHTQT